MDEDLVDPGAPDTRKRGEYNSATKRLEKEVSELKGLIHQLASRETNLKQRTAIESEYEAATLEYERVMADEKTTPTQLRKAGERSNIALLNKITAEKQAAVPAATPVKPNFALKRWQSKNTWVDDPAFAIEKATANAIYSELRSQWIREYGEGSDETDEMFEALNSTLARNETTKRVMNQTPKTSERNVAGSTSTGPREGKVRGFGTLLEIAQKDFGIDISDQATVDELRQEAIKIQKQSELGELKDG